MATFEYIIVESKGAVGVITLNRPKMLNALSFGVFREIALAIDDLEADDGIGCILLAGGEKAFAAGADIKEMQPKTFIDMFSSDFTTIGGDCEVRPAGNYTRHHSRHRWNAAADARDRQVQGDGPVSHRANDGRRRGG